MDAGTGSTGCSVHLFFTRERESPVAHVPDHSVPQSRPPFPRAFWIFLVGVFLFGLGDFSRTFLIWIAAQQLGGPLTYQAGTLSVAVLLYTLHNLMSAGVAYPVGHLGDRSSRLHILLGGIRPWGRHQCSACSLWRFTRLGRSDHDPLWFLYRGGGNP